ncbi:MAG: mechanosensitive ion channel family protein [Thalassobaculaceae bacterium]
MTLADIETALHSLWEGTAQFWKGEIFGINTGFALAGLAAVVLCLLLPSLLSRLISKTVVSVADGQDRDVSYGQLVDAIRAPMRLLPLVIGGMAATGYLEQGGDLRWAAANIVRSLIVIMLFWTVYRAVDPLARVSERWRRQISGPLVDWLAKTAKVVTVFLGVTAVLEVWGVNVAGLLAGLGLVGVAVALGAQDLFKNLISGILILAERRFENGDWIEVDGVIEGTVVQIGFRSTSIRRFDLSPVYVPNAKLSDNALTNFSRMPQRRIYWSIAVEYRTTVDQLREIRDGIEAFLIDNDEFVQPDQGNLFVRVNDFADSAIEILVYCFTRTTDWGEWLEIRERFAYHIKETVEGAGAGFAFPSRSLYIEADASRKDGDGGDDEGRPEPFTPPVDDRGSASRQRPAPRPGTAQDERGGDGEEEGE